MRLKKLQIQNYKSLRNIEFKPTDLTVVVGPNAAGKSNLALAFDFLSNVYNLGIEMAVTMHGGYENIAYRQVRRSRSAISFDLLVSLDEDEAWRRWYYPTTRTRTRSRRPVDGDLTLRHKFAFRAESRTVESDFKVVSESFSLLYNQTEDGSLIEAFRIDRNTKGALTEFLRKDDALSSYFRDWSRILSSSERVFRVPNQALALSRQTPLLLGPMEVFADRMSNCATYRLSPEVSRSTSAPAPNPELGVHGEHLPTIVSWLEKRYPKQWANVLAMMKEFVPSLENINVQVLRSQTLGLFFKESGISRPWTSDDVSDGTIRALGMLVAAVDPRSSMLVIEEPENSVHPWVIHSIVRFFRNVSKQKSVIITTHSREVLDSVLPEEVWVISKRSNASSLQQLTNLDPDVEQEWREGDITLSDYLGAGLIREAVPGTAQ